MTISKVKRGIAFIIIISAVICGIACQKNNKSNRPQRVNTQSSDAPLTIKGSDPIESKDFQISGTIKKVHKESNE